MEADKSGGQLWIVSLLKLVEDARVPHPCSTIIIHKAAVSKFEVCIDIGGYRYFNHLIGDVTEAITVA